MSKPKTTSPTLLGTLIATGEAHAATAAAAAKAAAKAVAEREKTDATDATVAAWDAVADTTNRIIKTAGGYPAVTTFMGGLQAYALHGVVNDPTLVAERNRLEGELNTVKQDLANERDDTFVGSLAHQLAEAMSNAQTNYDALKQRFDDAHNPAVPNSLADQLTRAKAANQTWVNKDARVKTLVATLPDIDPNKPKWTPADAQAYAPAKASLRTEFGL